MCAQVFSEQRCFEVVIWHIFVLVYENYCSCSLHEWSVPGFAGWMMCMSLLLWFFLYAAETHYLCFGTFSPNSKFLYSLVISYIQDWSVVLSRQWMKFIPGSNMLISVCLNEIITQDRDVLMWKLSEGCNAHQWISKSVCFLKCFLHEPCKSSSTQELF